MKRTFYCVGILLLFVCSVWTQDFVEVRAGITKDGVTYRYIDYNHTFKNKLVVDIAHYGAPGQNELWVGAGYNVKNEQFSGVISGYLVVGKENKQVGLGLASFGGGKVSKANVVYQVYSFIPTKGSVKRYLAVDSLDVTGNISKKVEIGGSAGMFLTGKNTNFIAGPMVKINDKVGSWNFSIRGGAYTEFRIGRTFNFQ